MTAGRTFRRSSIVVVVMFRSVVTGVDVPTRSFEIHSLVWPTTFLTAHRNTTVLADDGILDIFVSVGLSAINPTNHRTLHQHSVSRQYFRASNANTHTHKNGLEVRDVISDPDDPHYRIYRNGEREQKSSFWSDMLSSSPALEKRGRRATISRHATHTVGFAGFLIWFDVYLYICVYICTKIPNGTHRKCAYRTLRKYRHDKRNECVRTLSSIKWACTIMIWRPCVVDVCRLFMYG